MCGSDFLPSPDPYFRVRYELPYLKCSSSLLYPELAKRDPIKVHVDTKVPC